MGVVRVTSSRLNELVGRSFQYGSEEKTGPRGDQRPALLFLCQTLPYPPDGGVNIRTYNILRLLARKFDVFALCFYRDSDRQGPALVEPSLARLREIVHAEAFPLPQEHDRLRLLFDHARSVATGRSYTKYMYESRALRSRMNELMQQRAFSLVHVDSLDLCAYLPAVSNLPVVCVHHNVESQLLARRAAAEKSRWRRWYMAHQARLLEREERRWCPRVDINVVVSPNDQKVLEQIAPTARYAVVPNGVDTELFQPAAGRHDAVVFVGGSNWFPNRDARDYFVADIFPRLRALGCAAPVQWVGNAAKGDQLYYRERYGIDVTGYVEDVRPYLRDAACFIVPLRVGGGTRLKILDAWAMGKAIVSTSVGCEGLAAVDGENILIRDTAEGFAEAVAAVCADAALRDRLGSNGRATAERLYSWEVLGESMLEAYGALARGESA